MHLGWVSVAALACGVGCVSTTKARAYAADDLQCAGSWLTERRIDGPPPTVVFEGCGRRAVYVWQCSDASWPSKRWCGWRYVRRP